MMLKAQIADYITQNPLAITLDMASHFGKPEGEILCALPDEFVRVLPGERAEEVLAEISSWGIFTTIIEKEGSIFEIKDRFPTGMVGRGYYNLNMKDEEGTLHGHIKLDNISKIAFVSLPFRGKESYNIAFIANNGQTIFKVYLGRDAERQLFPEQVQKFKAFI
ncbi:heme utilization cystosolic carrier protein HutX [Pasteurella multocida]|uniref:heme utilization cystosolic carrier protein HutX n=2 Tax=Pasteurella multocida TaxID=747 RepID=UPI0009F4C573|nr:heme utilization cystosolic carrier protein HutX [Pasteurella multocida]MDY0579047.1 heme utilization cystosolic carrier protein HutX [Pasteurella multocida]MEB3471938.1 heme utilization cystosolic carrier protein HutX [Pasteurella multocida]MEB3482125.1 heme utilization cystosolic carrier protein HutX [Pasteurella multocida]MEB3486024.1 heme utilization cystosolic carrier protein HutX [Pasteurella multocida]MEB3497589.1 heme utilization cystosolic carrier protein HutX [Pasteurella multocid